MRDLRDQELIEKALISDQRAWKELVSRYYRKVYATAVRIYGSHVETEDVVQEVFVQLAKSLPNFRGDSNFSTFLYRLSVNTICGYLKTNKKKSDFMVNGFEEFDNIFTASESSSPFEFVKHEGMKKNVYRLLRGLKFKKRSAVIFYEIENMDLKEISNLFKEPVQTIWSRVRSGKKDLLKMIEKHPLSNGGGYEKQTS